MENTVLMAYTVIDELLRRSVRSGNSGPVNTDEMAQWSKWEHKRY